MEIYTNTGQAFMITYLFRQVGGATARMLITGLMQDLNTGKLFKQQYKK